MTTVRLFCICTVYSIIKDNKYKTYWDRQPVFIIVFGPVVCSANKNQESENTKTVLKIKRKVKHSFIP